MTGWVACEVTAELVNASRMSATIRGALREAMRSQAEGHVGAAVKLDRFRIDPFERHGIDAAPRRTMAGVHVFMARVRTIA